MPPLHPKIAISYRRQDKAAAYAGLIYGRFTRYFLPDDIFFDVASVESGTDFDKALQRAFYYCLVVIVVIGEEWEVRKSDNTKLLMNPDDWVRKELEITLSRFGKDELHPSAHEPLVIPVLVNRLQMPDRANVPIELHGLLTKQAESFTHERFREDTDRILKKVYRHIYGHEDLLDIITQEVTGGVVGKYDSFDGLAVHAVEKAAAKARNIRIMQTWIPHIGNLVSIVQKALENDAEVRVLLLETDEAFVRPYFGDQKNIHVKERAANLGYAADEGIREIEHTTTELKKIWRRLSDTKREKLKLRLCDGMFSMQCYICDDKALVGLYWFKKEAPSTHQIEIRGIDTPLYVLISREFDQRWIDATRELDFESGVFKVILPSE